MNIAMQMTVDQLLRSLRGMAHDMAERVEVRPPRRRESDTGKLAREPDDERRD